MAIRLVEEVVSPLAQLGAPCCSLSALGGWPLWTPGRPGVGVERVGELLALSISASDSPTVALAAAGELVSWRRAV